VTQNRPTSPGAADTAWTTGVAWKSPVVSPSPGGDPPAPGGQHVAFPGDADPGGRDIVAASSAQAMANAEARYGELQGDTYGQGSRIGDLLDLPPVVSDWSKHTGGSDATSYDPAG
jgi:hypothetical protein